MAVRITESQGRLLFGKKPRAAIKRGAGRRLNENTVESQIVGFLQAKGWTVTRQQSGLFTRPGAERSDHCIRIGEKGTPDWRAERPRPCWGPGAHQLLYVEVKAPGRHATVEQWAWILRRRALGTPAVCADSLVAFRAWYVEQRFYG